MYLQHHQLAEVAGVKQTAKKKAQKQRCLDVLTEGVSFSSDRSLSPCSKNSLVTNSATFRERKDEWRDATIIYILLVLVKYEKIVPFLLEKGL